MSDRPQGIQKTDSPPHSAKNQDSQAASLRWRGHYKAALINTNKGFARKEKKYIIETQE
jgi:hypothetical protein